MVDFTSFLNSTYFSALPELITKDIGSNLTNLALYSLGMFIYVVVIWHFYRHLAKREIISIKLKKPKNNFFAFFVSAWGVVVFIVKSLVIYPLITALWFLILGGFLLFLSKSHEVATVLLISMTVIVVSRITAYYNEELSKEVAKLVPFVLLGIFIVDTTYFSIETTIEKFMSLPLFTHIIVQYLIAIVLLEFVLSLFHKLRHGFFSEEKESTN
ncbi:TPA: hypothetical protein HA239_02390 [Candidatus Woesearchaeota archaeon]|nr:hypothetical protein QT06_C0001G1082 [archaeon GW2011_AR15]MBS3104447.1 hypothetical protein [Candidatus Woesearchaeota archaeon]HIH41238.1 hypothetical protein [Candidatus Woesearchaeota archaeon]